ncbi:MAG: hypothetical protein HY804_09110 [Nitrospinae bacterium]|nr:hypothetical protein [Nitrospinota bacterium]
MEPIEITRIEGADLARMAERARRPVENDDRERRDAPPAAKLDTESDRVDLESAAMDALRADVAEKAHEPVKPVEPKSAEKEPREDPPKAPPAPALYGDTFRSENTLRDYAVTEERDLVLKILDKEDTRKVLRQYPTEGELNYRSAFRRFMELIGVR